MCKDEIRGRRYGRGKMFERIVVGFLPKTAPGLGLGLGRSCIACHVVFHLLRFWELGRWRYALLGLGR